MDDYLSLKELVSKHGVNAINELCAVGLGGDGYTFKLVGISVEYEVFEPTASMGKPNNIYIRQDNDLLDK